MQIVVGGFYLVFDYNSLCKGGICMSFAENLKQLRKEKQLSQEELAEILDVSRQAVSKWEQGIGYPEVEKLLLLSSKLNILLFWKEYFL